MYQPLQPDAAAIKKFLSEMHPDVSDQNRLAIWIKQGGQNVSKTTWFSDTDAAAEHCAQVASTVVGADIYYGLSLHNYDMAMAAMEKAKGHVNPEHTRGVYASTSAINCVWLDLDIGQDGHKKPTPATIEDAIDLLDSAYGDMRPTVTVASGGGLHCYWLFHEPLFFNTEIDRVESQSLVSKWQACIHVKAADVGYVIDRTADLSRVLRVPETANWKTGTPRQVRIVGDRLITDWRRRYDQQDLLDWCQVINPGDKYIQGTTLSKPHKAIDLTGRDVFPIEKWEMLCEADPRVLRVFRHEESLDGDNSDSAYDMSLSISAARVGWTDGEIYALIVAHRNQEAKRRGSEVKEKHQGYYTTTIQKARSFVAKMERDESRGKVFDEIRDSIEGGELDEVKGDEGVETKPARDALIKRHLSQLKAAIGIEVKSIKKYMAQPPYYAMETDRGVVNLGDVDGLISQKRFKSSVAATNGFLMRKQDAGEWHVVAQLLLHACEEVDLGGEGDEGTETIEWIRAHIGNGILSDVYDAIKQRSPVAQDDDIYFYLSSLSKTVELEFHKKVARQELSRRCKSVGCENVKLRLRAEDGRSSSSQRLWLVPADMVRDMDENEMRADGASVVDIRKLSIQ